MTAENLIDILECAAHNMGVSLQEMIVNVIDPRGYVFSLEGYEQVPGDGEDESILRLKC